MRSTLFCLSVLAALTLQACGGGGSDSDSGSTENGATAVGKATSFIGTWQAIGDEDGLYADPAYPHEAGHCYTYGTPDGGVYEHDLETTFTFTPDRIELNSVVYADDACTIKLGTIHSSYSYTMESLSNAAWEASGNFVLSFQNIQFSEAVIPDAVQMTMDALVEDEKTGYGESGKVSLRLKIISCMSGMILRLIITTMCFQRNFSHTMV